ncbi:hypothetical protein NIES2109_64570 (plasmid) [Nostoc sp. HK-01]|nr:hypothetical protein NIES2109_64570 [Nostoc sp. HK-01]
MLLRFKLRKADGGKVRATVFLDGEELAEGCLTESLDELKSSFRQWQEAYLGLEDVALRLTPVSVKQRFSRDEIARFAESFRQGFDEWLRGDAEWQKAREKLARRLANRSEGEIRIFLDVDEADLRRFPWQDWEFFQEYCQDAEVALCERIDATKTNSPSGSVKVLVVVGNNEGIAEGIREDLKAIEELEQQNKGIFNVLEQPSRHELLDSLRSQPYEIFIFTGHSGSSDNKEIGWIGLSQTDSLKITDLKLALRQAINQRLQLCIFNSCDGLGLAKQLAELKLPLAIVMREPVPDEVAARFLRVFLQNFSNGESFFRSFREARHGLEGFNAKYPGVYWLPSICIGMSVEPPTWQQLSGFEEPITDKRGFPPPPPPSVPFWKRLLLPIGLVAVTLLSLAVGNFWLTFNQMHSIDKNIVTKNDTKRTSIKDIQPPQISGTVPYGGSTSAVFLDNMIRPVIHQLHKNFTLKPSFSNTGKGLEQMFDPNKNTDERLQFIFASKSVNRLNTKLEHIADDAIAVVVNPNLPVKSLTLDDLRRIITGEVTDWREIIGGQSIPIHVYFRPESGTEEFLKEALPLTSDQKDKAFKGKNSFAITNPQSPLEEAKNKVQNDPGGIYFVTASESVHECEFKPVPILGSGNVLVAPYKGQLIARDSNCAQLPQEKRNQVNIEAIRNSTYPLIRPIYLVLRTDDPTAKKWGEYYLNVLRTDEGKDLILKAGFLPK